MLESSCLFCDDMVCVVEMGNRMATRVLPGDLAREARLCNDMDVVSVLGLIKPWTGSAACAEH